MEGIDFPNSITEINYLETKDSIISKTKFSNFMFDRELDREMLEFEIPESAILVNRLQRNDQCLRERQRYREEQHGL